MAAAKTKAPRWEYVWNVRGTARCPCAWGWVSEGEEEEMRSEVGPHHGASVATLRTLRWEGPLEGLKSRVS